MHWIAGTAVVLAACGDPSDHARYLDDRAFRREALIAELVSFDNEYARLRLARYGTSWDDLPVWNPAVAAAGVDEPASSLLLETSPDDLDALRALGEQAFFRYPVQTLPRNASQGLWRDPVRGDGGLVRIGPAVAATCATCHAMLDAGALVPGLANAELDLGWGPGRLDVTTTDGHEPVKIPDLRPVRWLGYLHADATVRQRDVIALAVRIETLIITSHHEAVRPPPIVALALATYLWSLAPAPPSPPRTIAEKHGAELFAARCAGCHAGPGFTGEPVPLARVGTDPAVGRSLDRGTGFYRVPSLRRVSDRVLLLHDGSVRSLAELLDPARPSPGHRFGTSLSAPDRADLAAFVSTL